MEYTRADVELFRQIQPAIDNQTLDRETAIRFLALGWLQQLEFGADKWITTEAGLRQMRD